MAQCFIHENKKAKARCKKCRRVICEDCMPAYKDEEIICPICKKEELEKDVNNYFWILVFIGIAFVAAGLFVMWFVKNTLKGFEGIETVGIIVISAIILAGLGFFVYLFVIDWNIYKNCSKRLNIALEYLRKQAELEVEKNDNLDEEDKEELADEVELEEPKEDIKLEEVKTEEPKEQELAKKDEQNS